MSWFVIFVVHPGISGTPLRAVLRNALVESSYLGVYLLFSFGSRGGKIYGYVPVPHMDFIGVPSAFPYKVAKTFMLFALVTIVMSVLVKNPTAVMSEQAPDQ